MTVEERLKVLFPKAKRTTLKQMVQTGRVRLGAANGEALRRLSEALPEGKDLVVLDKGPEPARHRRGTLDIIFEDDDVLVVNKAPGLLTATVPQEKRPTLHAKVTEYLERTSPRSRIGLVHRLDKDARGLLVFSKHHESFFALKEQLKDRRMSRVYHAVVLGVPNPAEGTIKSLLREDPVTGFVTTTTDTRKSEEAITHYKVVKSLKGGPRGGTGEGLPGLSLVRVELETGRKHQIRVHMADRGHHLLGDAMYGKARFNNPPLYLIASTLGFIHPRTGEPVEFEISIPKDFTDKVAVPGAV